MTDLLANDVDNQICMKKHAKICLQICLAQLGYGLHVAQCNSLYWAHMKDMKQCSSIGWVRNASRSQHWVSFWIRFAPNLPGAAACKNLFAMTQLGYGMPVAQCKTIHWAHLKDMKRGSSIGWVCNASRSLLCLSISIWINNLT
jgi:hypothetical protein